VTQTGRGVRMEANDIRERNNGIMEDWNDGRVKEWNDGMMGKEVTSYELSPGDLRLTTCDS